ncbi:hypothetical protein [Phaeobacter sp.]|uniref:hypothetical protein n=1 Tax=Phaeobacter sp. TaxID=1902409 RepID=UPI0025E25797|nr:hypothetical protein [Phaeobacter sp.]
MPHAEIKYTDGLSIDPQALLAQIESRILAHDDGAGACKGRAIKIEDFHHRHIDIKVALLVKPHRDAAFSQALLADLRASLLPLIPKPSFFSLEVTYSGPFYITEELVE